MGVGDPFGMSIAHIMASAMGGILTAGDLVAWMQLSRRMKIPEAKRYVANKLGVTVMDLTDEAVMRPVREELGIGLVTAVAGSAKGIAAKCRISELLEVPIPSVDLFRTTLLTQG